MKRLDFDVPGARARYRDRTVDKKDDREEEKVKPKEDAVLEGQSKSQSMKSRGVGGGVGVK